MRLVCCILAICLAGGSMSISANSGKPVMDGFPPSVDSQVTKKNHRDWPYSQWAFRNFGAPNNVVMVPRAGEIAHFDRSEDALDSFELDGDTLAAIF